MFSLNLILTLVHLNRFIIIILTIFRHGDNITLNWKLLFASIRNNCRYETLTSYHPMFKYLFISFINYDVKMNVFYTKSFIWPIINRTYSPIIYHSSFTNFVLRMNKCKILIQSHNFILNIQFSILSIFISIFAV